MVTTPIPRWLDACDDHEKPYVEFLDGERVPKMSPKGLHSILQTRIGAVLDAWARGRGYAGSEWRFYFPTAEDARWSSLLPDVSYVAQERLQADEPDARSRPRFAPDLAVEILSPGDRASVLARKIALYLAHGARVVLVVRAEQRRVDVHRAGAASVEERLAHAGMAAGAVRRSGARLGRDLRRDRPQPLVMRSAARYAASASALKQQKITRSGSA